MNRYPTYTRCFNLLLHTSKFTLYIGDGGVSKMNTSIPPSAQQPKCPHWSMGPFASSGCLCLVLQLNTPPLTLIPLPPHLTSLSAICTTFLLNQQWKGYVFTLCTCRITSNQPLLSHTSQAFVPNLNHFILMSMPSDHLNSSTELSRGVQNCMAPLLTENGCSLRATFFSSSVQPCITLPMMTSSSMLLYSWAGTAC